MKTVIVYTCNAGWLVPGLVSAIGARQNTNPEEADVLLFDIGVPTAEGDAIAAVAAENSVRYIRLDPSILDGLHITYARLLMDRYLPPEYSDFIYVDGDTQVWGRLDDLVRAPVDGGKILACRDSMSFVASADPGRCADWIGYIESIGLSPTTYVNAGVLKAERKSWSALGEQAFREILGGKKFRFVDQDIINILARDRIEQISLKWNFPWFFLCSGIEDQVKTRIVHYLGNPRPWHGSFYPWGAYGWRMYDDLVRSHPQLTPYWIKLKLPRYARYVAQQQYRRFLEMPFYRGPKFRGTIDRAETQRMV